MSFYEPKNYIFQYMEYLFVKDLSKILVLPFICYFCNLIA